MWHNPPKIYISMSSELAQSSTAICLIQRISVVKILPKAAVQEKNAILGGTFDCHTIFQGKEMTEEGGIESDKNLEPRNLFSLLASNKLHQHHSPVHPWNKAYPKKDPKLLTPNLVLDNEIGCPNEASHQRNT